MSIETRLIINKRSHRFILGLPQDGDKATHKSSPFGFLAAEGTAWAPSYTTGGFHELSMHLPRFTGFKNSELKIPENFNCITTSKACLTHFSLHSGLAYFVFLISPTALQGEVCIFTFQMWGWRLRTDSRPPAVSDVVSRKELGFRQNSDHRMGNGVNILILYFLIALPSLGPLFTYLSGFTDENAKF